MPLLTRQQQEKQGPSSPPSDTELEEEEESMPDATNYPTSSSSSPAHPSPANALESQEEADEEKIMRDLHTLLLETEVMEGMMVCGNCGHEYRIKEGIANFLLPAHLV